MRRDGKLWLIAPLLCIWPIAANADDGEAAKVVTECGAADLPQASLDSCLERVRVLEETEPSPQLQALEATLERREIGRPASTLAAGAAPPAAAPAPESTFAEGEGTRDQSNSQPADPDSSAPRSGVTLEDEPPVSDAPDVPAGTDRTTDDDSSNPQQP